MKHLKIKSLILILFLLSNVAFCQKDCEPITTFPWVEGFEENGIELPLCWENITNSQSWQWTVVPNAIGTPPTTFEGNFKARIYYSTNLLPIYQAQLKSPVFDLSTLNNPALVYWHTQRERGRLHVYYTNSSEEPWVLLQTFSDNILDWQGEIVLLPEKSNDYQITFFTAYIGGIAEIQLDDIKIMELNDVVDVELSKIITPITGINHTNAEPIKVLLKNNGGELLTGFTLELELDGEPIATEIFTDTIQSLEEIEYTLLTTLDISEEATYQITVTVILENDLIETNNSKTITVKNHICQTITSFPWVEGFEDQGATIPSCFSEEIITGNTHWNVVTASTGFPNTTPEGNYKAQFKNITTNHISRFLTYIFDLSDVNDPVLSFWHAQTKWSTYPGILRIYYKNSSEGEWNLLREFTEDISGWQREFISLPNKSNYYQIAFEGDISTSSEIHLDGISIFEGIVSSYQVNIETNSGNSISGAIVSLSNQDENPEHIYTAIADDFGTIFHDISPGYYNLEITLAGHHSYTANDLFIIELDEHTAQLIEILVAPSDLSIEIDDENRTALFRWEHNKSSKSLQGFTVYLDNEEVAKEVQNTEFLFTNLTDGNYMAGVAADYTSGVSDFVTIPFNVINGIETLTPEHYSLSPNPVQNILTVKRLNAKKVTVKIYNSIGVLVHSFETSDIEFEINVSNYSTGSYCISLSDNNRSITKSFIKQ